MRNVKSVGSALGEYLYLFVCPLVQGGALYLGDVCAKTSMDASTLQKSARRVWQEEEEGGRGGGFHSVR